MADRRGNEALALIQNKEFIGRMNGLINLYTIDPSDAEGRGTHRSAPTDGPDLARSQPTTTAGSVSEQLRADVSQFLGSGFSREPLAEDDQALRSQLFLS